MPAPLEIRRYTIDPVTSTTITAPFACHTVRLQQVDQANDARFFSPEEMGIPAGGEIEFTNPVNDMFGGTKKQGWASGDVVGTVLSVAGTGPIAVTFQGFVGG
jgi:hypothetical protein